jgi:hypothetical protein
MDRSVIPGNKGSLRGLPPIIAKMSPLEPFKTASNIAEV